MFTVCNPRQYTIQVEQVSTRRSKGRVSLEQLAQTNRARRNHRVVAIRRGAIGIAFHILCGIATLHVRVQQNAVVQ
jgi:hypothetical protein